MIRMLSFMVFLTCACHLTPATWGDFIRTAISGDPCSFSITVEWTFPEEGNDFDSFVHDNWQIVYNSPEGQRNPTIRDLEIRARHTSFVEECDPGHGGNPISGLMRFPNVQRPPIGPTRRFAAAAISHGDHSDAFFSILTAGEKGNLVLDTKGMHAGKRPFSWSLSNSSTDLSYQFSVFPSYRNADGTIHEPDMPSHQGTIGPEQAAGAILPRHPKDGRLPSNYRISAFRSDDNSAGIGSLSDPTLAFIGLTNGIDRYTELDLAVMTDLFGSELPIGEFEFLAPGLADSNDLQDLYIFIDLVPWLGSGATFSPFDEFEIVDGRNDSLPGVFVSSTPISLNSDGSLNGDAWQGSASAFLTIDGQTVPEPAALSLLLFCGTFAALSRSRRPYRTR